MVKLCTCRVDQVMMWIHFSEVNVSKHLVCEPCGPMVAGGYDPDAQQVSKYRKIFTAPFFFLFCDDTDCTL